MLLLDPGFCILDETDSGLDIDALRIVADGVNQLRSPDRAMLVITHYQRLLDYIVPIMSTSCRGPHRAFGRQGPRPRTRRKGLRLDYGRRHESIPSKPRRRSERNGCTLMSAAFESLLALRAETVERLREGEADWIGRLRDEALISFEEQGFPTRRLEDWKSTNLAPLEAISFERVGTSEQNPVVVTGDGVPELRFVDGRLETANTQAENLPVGVQLLSFAEARRQTPELLEGLLGKLASPKRNAMAALQTAFLDDGALLSIDAGVELETPIKFSFSTSGDSASPASAAFPRLLVIAGECSRSTISIECESTAPGLTALVAEFYLAPGARFESVQIQNEHAGRIHFTSANARLERGASFDSHVISLSPGMIRSELEISLAEPGAETRMRGFYLGRGDGHVDHFTTVDHAAASCTSDEEYRGVLGDRSAGVFRGRVIVRPGAQRDRRTSIQSESPDL